jgi:ABC-type cobalamin transport system permease subunit
MKRRHYLGLLVVGVGIALSIALFSPLASSEPDGLEKVAENHGFMTQAEGAPYEVIADYVLPGVDNEHLATVLAGIIGVIIVAAIALAIAFLLRRLRGAQRSTSSGGGPG